MTTNHLLDGHSKDLGGGFLVSRVLPAAQQRSVGPFVFFDHFGPVTVPPESNFDVRPHPHIGLATISYMFEGAIMHRDSLGSEQLIEAGAINWMTAGNGIVHSERRPEHLKDSSYVNHGLQLWIALPADKEEIPAFFEHTPADDIPEIDMDGAKVRVLVGRMFGAASPVSAVSPTTYLDIELQPGASIDIPAGSAELAVYPVTEGAVIDGQAIAPKQMAVMETDAAFTLSCASNATAPLRAVIVGGAPLDGPRFMWWNFVSSRKERIKEAALLWGEGGFERVPGEHDFIPLPATPFPT